MDYGKKVWIIPDGYLQSRGTPPIFTHEGICILNTGKKDAMVKATLYFNDRPKVEGAKILCGGECSIHVMTETLTDLFGQPCVPKDTPYAILLESNVNIIVQYSRADSSQSPLTLMTTIAYTP